MTVAVVAAKPPLLYSLPSRCPLPWPMNPSYPVACTATRDLNEAYDDSLASTRLANLSLDAFAQLVIQVASRSPRAEAARQLRSLILPLHDFDKRWRSSVPELVRPASDGDDSNRAAAASSKPVKPNKPTVTQKQQSILLESYDLWKRDAWKRKQPSTHTGSGATDRDGSTAPDAALAPPTEDTDWTKDDSGDLNEWLTLMELYETRLQALLLLALIAYPEDTSTIAEVKLKKRNPEKHASTLDPELLLDFLTDRLQIWRIMKDVVTTDVSTDDKSEAPQKIAADLDEVQLWWEEVVERRFAAQVSEKTLFHHRAKLFPSKSTADALTVRVEPEPSPFKARSLLSLDKSARQREKQDAMQAIAQSPTMRRLIKLSSNAGPSRRGNESEDEATFRVPMLATKKAVDGSAGSQMTTDATNTNGSHNGQASRKQDRTRALSRAPSLSSTSSSKHLFNRREVSLPKRPTAVARKSIVDKKAVIRKEGEPRKRKNPSPKKLFSSNSHPLVLGTPAKVTSGSQSNNLARAATMPSFAALGAAFRPGSIAGTGSVILPPGVPSPPQLPGDVDAWSLPGQARRVDSESRVPSKRPVERNEADDEENHFFAMNSTPVSKRKFVIPDT
ncbi:hypothetical protein ACM66B_000942 [Microbotryomycetes sp. NB124-2]